MKLNKRTICAVGLLLVAAFANSEDPARKLVVAKIMSGEPVTHTYFMNDKQVESLTVRDGDEILVVLKDLNPLLFDIKIEGETIAAPKDPNTNPFLPGTVRITNMTIPQLKRAFLAMKAALVVLMKGEGGRPKPTPAYVQDAQKVFKAVFSDAKPSETITSATIKKMADTISGSQTVAEDWKTLAQDIDTVDPGLPKKDSWNATTFDAWAKDFGEFVDEINKIADSSKVVKVKLNDPRDGFAINVSVSRKSKIHGIESPLSSDIKSFAERYVVKAVEPAPNRQGSAGFVFSFVPDQSYAVDTGTNTIVKRGTTNNPTIAVGYLYHFRMTDRYHFTMGATASEASSLSYLGGFSLRMGDKKSAGFLTLGFIASQVTGLDGVALGQTWNDPKVPTKKFYRSGLALGFSFSIG